MYVGQRKLRLVQKVSQIRGSETDLAIGGERGVAQ